jgi:Fe-S cluster assembly protein SufD
VRGFFADVIGQIGVPDVEQRLLEKVEAELSRAVTAGEAR